MLFPYQNLEINNIMMLQIADELAMVAEWWKMGQMVYQAAGGFSLFDFMNILPCRSFIRAVMVKVSFRRSLMGVFQS